MPVSRRQHRKQNLKQIFQQQMPESKLFKAKKTELAQTLENLSANQTAIDEGKAKLMKKRQSLVLQRKR